jgi:putative aminopeptidase FrvX
MQLLQQLCQIHAPSGNESLMTEFILSYVKKNSPSWKVKPQIVAGKEWQDCVMLVFGKPRTAVFAHIDSIGFTVRYDNHLVPIGGPETKTGYALTGQDSKGKIECNMVVDSENDYLVCDALHTIDRGTDLVFKCNFRETDEYVQSCYLDNRLGVWNTLKLAETLENGVLVFSCYEEHGGGTVPFLMKYLYETYHIRQTLVCDITWVTEGVEHGKGVAISMRDTRIPRKSYLEKIIAIAKDEEISFQLEVERYGGSDGKEIQSSPYPVDWCFVGAPESGVHSPDEKVYKNDINSMLALYQVLMEKL